MVKWGDNSQRSHRTILLQTADMGQGLTTLITINRASLASVRQLYCPAATSMNYCYESVGRLG